MRNQGQVFKGRAKEAAGRITDNEQWQAEGRMDQAKGQTKGAIEKLKDAFGSLFGRRSSARNRSRTDTDRRDGHDDRYSGSI